MRGQSKQEIYPQKANILEQSYSSEARVSSQLNNETEIKQKLDSRTQGFENDVACHSERSEESQSLPQRMDSPLTPPLSRRAREQKYVILSKNSGAKKQFGDRGEGSQSKIKMSYFGLSQDRTLTPTSSPNWRGGQKPVFTLAEGATHVDMFHYIRKSAFTLAEVLVTLGIIGVVAAMTLPMLAENYQRRIVETRLKKFYTTFNQAILRSVNDNGPSEAWGYQVTSEYASRENIDAAFSLYLRPYMNITQTREVVYTNGKSTTLYYFADGSAFTYTTVNNYDIFYYPKDTVRCLTQPAINRGGVCEFYFAYVAKDSDTGMWLHHINKGLEPYKYAWDGRPDSLYSNTTYGCNTNSTYLGRYCTAVIQENGWEFPQNYPLKIRY